MWVLRTNLIPYFKKRGLMNWQKLYSYHIPKKNSKEKFFETTVKRFCENVLETLYQTYNPEILIKNRY